MLNTTKKRSHALRLSRGAVVALGLGLGWLLLTGSGASASDVVSGNESISHVAGARSLAPASASPTQVAFPETPVKLSSIISTLKTMTPSSTAAAVGGSESATDPGLASVADRLPLLGGLLQPAVSVITSETEGLAATISLVPNAGEEMKQTVSAAVTETTVSVSAAIGSVPDLLEPVLPRPLNPVVPTVATTTNALSGTVTAVGATLGDTVSTLPLSTVTVPVAHVGGAIVSSPSGTLLPGIAPLPGSLLPGIAPLPGSLLPGIAPLPGSLLPLPGSGTLPDPVLPVLPPAVQIAVPAGELADAGSGDVRTSGFSPQAIGSLAVPRSQALGSVNQVGCYSAFAYFPQGALEAPAGFNDVPVPGASPATSPVQQPGLTPLYSAESLSNVLHGAGGGLLLIAGADLPTVFHAPVVPGERTPGPSWPLPSSITSEPGYSPD
jgi:hypothetical protein